jgi:hypothetical protein
LFAVGFDEAEVAEEPEEGVVVAVDDAFFEGDDGVVGDVNVFGADLGAALGDVAVADAGGFFNKGDAVGNVEGVHLEAGQADHKARAHEVVFLVVGAQHVANVLAQKALDTLAEFLGAVGVFLVKAPLGHVGVGGGKGFDFFVLLVVPRHVGDQVANDGEGFERLDDHGLGQVDVVEAGFAHERGFAVDLGRARAALGGLAVPADGQVGRLGALNAVHGVEDDHAVVNGDFVFHHLATLGVAAEHLKRGYLAFGYGASGHGASWTPRQTIRGAEVAKREERGLVGFGGLVFLGKQGFQVVGHLGFGLVAVLQTAVVATPDNGVDLFELRVVVGELFAGVAATAFATLEGALGHHGGADEHGLEIEHQMPAGVKGAATGDADFGGAGFEGFELGLGFEEFAFSPDNADLGLHEFLQVAVNGVGRFAPFAFKGLGQLGNGGVDVGLVEGDTQGVGFGKFASVEAGASAKHQQVAQAVTAQAVRAVKARTNLSGGKQAGDTRHLGLKVDHNAAHGVVGGGAHFHGAFGDVDVGQFFKLVVHAGELALDVIGVAVRDIQVHAAVGGATAFLDLAVNGLGHDVAGGEFHPFGVDVLHKALAVAVGQQAAFATDGLGNQQAFNAGGPDHAGGVELDEFHVAEFGPGFVGQVVAVAGVLPRVAGNFVGFANAAGGQHNGFGLEQHQLAGLAVVAQGPLHHAVAVFKQVGDGELHKDVDARMHAFVLQGANHLEAGAVAHMAQTAVGVATKRTLADFALGGAVKHGTPEFELANAVGGFGGVDFGHAPVV